MKGLTMNLGMLNDKVTLLSLPDEELERISSRNNYLKKNTSRGEVSELKSSIKTRWLSSAYTARHSHRNIAKIKATVARQNPKITHKELEDFISMVLNDDLTSFYTMDSLVKSLFPYDDDVLFVEEFPIGHRDMNVIKPYKKKKKKKKK